MEHEDRPLVGRQAAEPAVELVPVADGKQVVACGRTVIDRQHSEVRGPSTLTRRLGDADIDQQALEPRIESVRIAEPLQVTPGDHQRILEGILGPIDVAQDPLGDGEQPVGPNADQVDVRVPIPVPCRLDEVAIHGSLSCEPLSVSGLRIYWSSGPPSRSFFGSVSSVAFGPRPREGTTCTSGSSTRI